MGGYAPGCIIILLYISMSACITECLLYAGGCKLPYLLSFIRIAKHQQSLLLWLQLYVCIKKGTNDLTDVLVCSYHTAVDLVSNTGLTFDTLEFAYAFKEPQLQIRFDTFTKVWIHPWPWMHKPKGMCIHIYTKLSYNRSGVVN